MIDKHTLDLWKIDCDKCEGHGKLFTEGIWELIKREREARGIKAKQVALVARIPYTRYCKFENGYTRLSNIRINKLIEIITGWGEENDRNATTINT